MKRFFIITTVLAALSLGVGGKEKTEHIGFIVTSVSPERVHDTANKFQEDVGNKLKAMYPAKVKNVTVEISHFFMRDNSTVVHVFKWDAELVQCEEKDADHYFDRRGTYLNGISKSAARDSVIKEMKQTRKAELLEQEFKKLGSTRTVVKESQSGNEKLGFWALREVFVIAKK